MPAAFALTWGPDAGLGIGCCGADAGAGSTQLRVDGSKEQAARFEGVRAQKWSAPKNLTERGTPRRWPGIAGLVEAPPSDLSGQGRRLLTSNRAHHVN
ncbi:MAG: hypothetical protein JW940_12630 [Polyangiaceae bacterium]|nr:hypothetical protein [Polyangiaceae bacterium]